VSSRLPDPQLSVPAQVGLAVVILLLLGLAVLALRADDGTTAAEEGDGAVDEASEPGSAATDGAATTDGASGQTPTDDVPADDEPGTAASPADQGPGPADAATGAGALPHTNGVALPPGTCIDDDGRAADVSAVTVVDCDQPHTGEVFAATRIDRPDDAPYPGQDTLQADSQQFCQGQAYTDYVGVSYAETRFFVYWLVPTEATWAAGDRDVACVLYDVAGPMTGSVEGSGR
jgi:hypothetical protein